VKVTVRTPSSVSVGAETAFCAKAAPVNAIVVSATALSKVKPFMV